MTIDQAADGNWWVDPADELGLSSVSGTSESEIDRRWKELSHPNRDGGPIIGPFASEQAARDYIADDEMADR